jgi:hypothetical protein
LSSLSAGCLRVCIVYTALILPQRKSDPAKQLTLDRPFYTLEEPDPAEGGVPFRHVAVTCKPGNSGLARDVTWSPCADAINHVVGHGPPTSVT